MAFRLPSGLSASTPVVLLTALSLPLAAPLSAQAQEPSVQSQKPSVISQAITTHIPAGPLEQVLNAYGQQTEQVLIFSPELTNGLNSNGLNGSYTVQQALATLLSNTDIKSSVKGGTITLSDANADVLMFDAVKVGGAAIRNTTEGTGSYTISAMSTATKLDLSNRETPQSITVLTRQRIDDEGIVDMVDVINKSPGLSVQSYGVGRPSFYSRGFSLDTVTEDGITSLFSSYIPSPLSNLAMYDRVEIVRGSTGLAQGAGNPSAAVNLMRKRPTKDFQAHISTNAGSWDDVSITADVGGAITDSDKIRGRLVAYWQEGDSFRDVEKEDTQMLYGTVDFDVSSNTTVNIGYSYLNTFTNMVWGGIPVSSDGQHLNVSRSTFVGANWEYLKQEVNTVYANIEHSLGDDWNVRLNMKYANTVSDVLATWLVADDVNGGYSHIYWAGEDDTDQFSADLYASGLVSLFGKSHGLVVGVSTNKEEVKNTEFFDCFNASCGVSSGFDVFNPDPKAPIKPSLAIDSPDRYGSPRKVSQKSVYSTMRWDLSDVLKLITGLRLDKYENIGAWSTTKEDGNLSFYGGIIYDFHQNHSLYMSYTDIFKPQDSVDINQKNLEPVIGKNYEIGVKGEYFDGLLNTNIAVFRIDQTNLEKELADQSVCPAFPNNSCFEASGLVRSEGIDLEIQGEIMPGWELGVGYTYSHIEYVKDTDLNNIGERLDTGIPEHLFKLNTTYTLPGRLNQWRIGGGLAYQSKIYYDLDTGSGMVRNRQDAYILADVMVAYAPTEHLSIQARVNNLFDKTYYQAIADSTVYSALEMYGEPRSFMVTVKYDF